MSMEKNEMMASIITAVMVVVGLIGLSIITPVISGIIDAGTTGAGARAAGALGATNFATAKVVLKFIPTFTAIGILVGAIGNIIGSGAKIKKVFGQADLQLKEALVGIVGTVVGVIGLAIFSPMINTLTSAGGGLVPSNTVCLDVAVAHSSIASGVLCTYPTAVTIVEFIPVFFAIGLLVGAISSITVAGGVAWRKARGA